MGMCFIYSLSRILGIYPFCEDGKSKTWVRVSIVLQIVTAAAYAKNLYVIYQKNHISLPKYFDFALLGIQFASTNIHFLRSILNRKVFDATIDVAQSKIPFWIDVAALVPILWKAFSALRVGIFDWKGYQWKLFPFTQSFFTYIIALQFISAVNTKTREIKILKRHILKYPEAACRRMYEIVDQVEEIHVAYAPQLLFVLTKMLMCAVYFGFKGITLSTTSSHNLFSLVNSFENLVWALFVFWSCSSFNQQAFYAELFRVIWKKNELCSNSKLCLYLNIQRSVEFRTYGLITLGYPLFTSTIAAATTYIVILLQFK